MSDDHWRERRRDADDFSEYGSLFDDAEPTQNMSEVPSEAPPEPSEPSEQSSGASPDDPISFGDGTGTLPHWTEPPTGEIPRLDATAGGEPAASRRRGARRLVVVLVGGAGVEGRHAPAGRGDGDPSTEVPSQRRAADRRDTGSTDGRGGADRTAAPGHRRIRSRRPGTEPHHDRHRPVRDASSSTRVGASPTGGGPPPAGASVGRGTAGLWP